MSEDLERLPNDGLRRQAVLLIRDLVYGRPMEAERLDDLPRLQASGLDLRGVHRAFFDLHHRREKGPRYQVVYQLLPPAGDSRQPVAHIIMISRLPSLTQERQAARNVVQRLGRPDERALDRTSRADRSRAPAQPGSRTAAAQSRSTTGSGPASSQRAGTARPHLPDAARQDHREGRGR